MITTNSVQEYPGVFVRIKAIIIDTIIMLLMMVGVTFLFSTFELTHENYRIGAFLTIFVFYDPLMTSLFAGTLGHKMNGLKVKKASDYDRNIIFPLAFLRFVFKSLLGWISLLSIGGNQERRAIHDFVAGSVVLYDENMPAVAVD